MVRELRPPAGQPVELSVVVPVYNCAECLEHLYARLKSAVGELLTVAELVFVDDRSTDDSWSRLISLANSDGSIKAIRLSKNFGQHAAITAGLGNSSGRWVVVMDCDLQDPPELIPALYRKALEGFDIVLAKREGRRRSVFRRVATRLYVRARNFLLQTQLDTDYATLSIISRKVVDAFLAVRDRDRHYILIIDWLGFRRATIGFRQQARFAGASSYSLGTLIRLALDGFFFQTTTLLRLIVYLGFWIALAGVGLASYYIYSYLTADPLPGFTAVIVVQLLVGGFILVSTGVAGLYIGKIFAQVKERPLFVVDQVHERPGPAAASEAPSAGAVPEGAEVTGEGRP